MSISTRQLAAALAGIVVFDAIWVRAPFLTIFGIPFLVAAWRYREGRLPTRIALGLWCALYVLVGVTFALSNGLQAPAEPNLPRETISPGDFAFAYFGTPLAAWLAVRLAFGKRRQRVSGPAAAALGLAIVVASLGAASSTPANAAGGNGASICSYATGPSGPYNLGANLRSHQPFNGDSNPGFAGPGFSPFCRP
jgi:hypothetical protein